MTARAIDSIPEAAANFTVSGPISVIRPTIDDPAYAEKKTVVGQWYD